MSTCRPSGASALVRCPNAGKDTSTTKAAQKVRDIFCGKCYENAGGVSVASIVDRIMILEVPATMTCHYCRAQNDNDAHRCSRCGRKTMERIPVQMTAAVPDLETVEMPAPAPIPMRPQLVTERAPKRPDAQADQPTYQASLFGPMEAARPSALSRPAPKRAVPRQRRDLPASRRWIFRKSRAALIYLLRLLRIAGGSHQAPHGGRRCGWRIGVSRSRCIPDYI